MSLLQSHAFSLGPSSQITVRLDPMVELFEVDPPKLVRFVDNKNTGRFKFGCMRFTHILSGDACARSAEPMAWNLSTGLHNT